VAPDAAASSDGHYFTDQPDVASRPTTVELALPELRVELATDTGVFSARRVDPGTRILLVDGPAVRKLDGRLLDLGCGYGPIAYALAHRAPDAQVWAVDVNRRALALAQTNLAGHPNVTVGHVDDVPKDLEFDEIWSNPPVRIGKQALRDLLTQWLSRLSVGGRAVLVVQRHLGADSLAQWLVDEGWPTERLRSRIGYRILEVNVP